MKTKRRSAIKLVAPCEDENDTVSLPRRSKRVSFSTELTEVREFQKDNIALAAIENGDAEPSKKKSGLEFKASQFLEELNRTDSNNRQHRTIQFGEGEDMEETVLVGSPNARELNQSVYVPQLTEVTMNMDDTVQNTAIFAANLKSSSTPDQEKGKAAGSLKRDPASSAPRRTHCAPSIIMSSQSDVSKGGTCMDTTRALHAGSEVPIRTSARAVCSDKPDKVPPNPQTVTTNLLPQTVTTAGLPQDVAMTLLSQTRQKTITAITVDQDCYSVNMEDTKAVVGATKRSDGALMKDGVPVTSMSDCAITMDSTKVVVAAADATDSGANAGAPAISRDDLMDVEPASLDNQTQITVELERRAHCSMLQHSLTPITATIGLGEIQSNHESPHTITLGDMGNTDDDRFTRKLTASLLRAAVAKEVTEDFSVPDVSQCVTQSFSSAKDLLRAGLKSPLDTMQAALLPLASVPPGDLDLFDKDVPSLGVSLAEDEITAPTAEKTYLSFSGISLSTGPNVPETKQRSTYVPGFANENHVVQQVARGGQDTIQNVQCHEANSEGSPYAGEKRQKKEVKVGSTVQLTQCHTDASKGQRLDRTPISIDQAAQQRMLTDPSSDSSSAQILESSSAAARLLRSRKHPSSPRLLNSAATKCLVEAPVNPPSEKNAAEELTILARETLQRLQIASMDMQQQLTFQDTELDAWRRYTELHSTVAEKEKEVELVKKRLAETKCQVEANRSKVNITNRNLAEKSEKKAREDLLWLKIGVLEGLVPWLLEEDNYSTCTSVYTFKLGEPEWMATLRLSVKFNNQAEMVIENAYTELRWNDRVLDLSQFKPALLKCLKSTVDCEVGKHVGNRSVPLLLYRLSDRILRTNRLLAELQSSFCSTGEPIMSDSGLAYSVVGDGFACIYSVLGFDIVSYPNKQFTFSMTPDFGNIPGRMADLCLELLNVPVGEEYLSRCFKLMRRAAWPQLQ